MFGRWARFVCIATAVATGVAACSLLPGQNESTKPIQIDSTVSNSGFKVSIPARSGVTVAATAPAGVAKPGTSVQVKAYENSAQAVDLDGLSAMVEPVSGGFTLALGDGDQPSVPVSITFTVDKGSPAEQDLTGDGITAVGLADHQGFRDLVPAKVASSAVATTYTFETTRLSGFSLGAFSIAGFADVMLKGADKFLGAGVDKPECVGKSATVDGVEFRVTTAHDAKNPSREDNAFWPCVVTRGSSLVLSVTANSKTGWEVSSDPAPDESRLDGFSIENNVTAGVLDAISGPGADPFLIPGATTAMTYRRTVPAQIYFRPDPGPMLVMSFLFGLDTLADTFGGEAIDFDRLMAVYGGAKCFSEEGDAFKDPNPITFIKVHLACIAGVAGAYMTEEWGKSQGMQKLASAPFRAVLGILTSGVQLLANGVTGLARTGNKLFVTVSSSTQAHRLFQSANGTVKCQMDSRVSGAWGGQGMAAPDVSCLTTRFSGPKRQFICSSNITSISGAASIRRGRNPTQGLCTGGQPFDIKGSDDSQFYSLRSGETSKLNGFTCIGGNEVVCKDDRSGKGFRISPSRVTLLGGDDTTKQGGTDVGIEDGPANVWQTKGAKLSLIPNYTGTLYFNSGCCAEKQWDVTWSASGNVVSVKLGRQTLATGTVSPTVQTGDTVRGTFGNGRMALTVASDSGPYDITLCRDTTSDCQ